jgi:hypothetical protein
MTRQTAMARVLMVAVFAPSGGLFGEGVAEATHGLAWWPWLVAALVWLIVSGSISVAVSNRLDQRR